MSKKEEEEKEREEPESGRMVPPGFRFHPTDEELVDFYLRKKVATSKFELDHVISEVDLNKLEPWDLCEKCKVDATHQTEWYFFSHKDKKYPTGTRTNRATKAGFWKATGRDKAVLSSTLSQPHQRIGMRKTLVFYKGRAPHGLKTDWIMHEYRLQDCDSNNHHHASKVLANEDGWVVCRVFKKKNYEEKNSTSASSYYDNTNLSDEDQAPNKSSHSTISTFLEAGSSQSVMSFSKPEQNLFRKEVHDKYSLGSPPFKTVGKNLPLFSCKQEVMGDQYEGLSINSYQPTPTTFFQLPHLETTETVSSNCRTIHNIVNNPSINPTYPLNGFERSLRGDGSQKVHHLAQCAQNFEEGSGTPNTGGKAYYMAEEDPTHCLDRNISSIGQHQLAENVNCWSLYENFARLQGTEGLANLANDQLFPHFNGAQLSKVQGAPGENYPSSYEIELWNFPR